MSSFFYVGMSKLYSLLMQKETPNAEVKDLLYDFGMVCTDVPYIMIPSIKELPYNDWADEHGDDVYIPDSLKIKSYDWEIGICYKGDMNTANTALELLLNYLTGLDGSGVKIKIYNPHIAIGRQGCYFTGTSNYSLSRTRYGDIAEFKIRFKVTDPVTKISLSK